jgi:outer membrane protein assembly factor BamB
MVKLTISSLLLIVFVFAYVQESFGQEDIEKLFRPIWKTKVGVSTYRTNLVFHNGSIFMGSNGLDRNFTNDSLDGVVELDAKTGKLKHIYQSPIFGDNDATGIALDGNQLYFGTDNYAFYCFHIKTKKMLWYKNLPYDVESKPALLDVNNDGVKDVFFSVQNHGFYALDGNTGAELWQFTRIHSHEGNASPLAIDCNKDGVMDIVVSGSRYQRTGENIASITDTSFHGVFHFALDGRTGSLMWIHDASSGIHSSPLLTKFDGKPILVFSDYLGLLQGVGLSGELIFQIPLDSYGSVSSLVAFDDYLIFDGNTLVPLSPTSFKKEEGKSHLVFDAFDKVIQIENKGFHSATPVVSDVLGLGVPLFINVSEQGFGFIINKKGTRLKHFTLPAGVEAPLLIHDMNEDGTLELLVADLDGNLTCYKSKGKARK